MIRHVSIAFGFTQLTRVFTTVVIVIGFSVLVGWQFNITIFKSIFPGIVNMNPLTALSFIFLGVSINLLTRKNSIHNYQKIVQFFAIFIFFVGALRLISLIFGIDIPHDQILFRKNILAISEFSNNRIAPNTAVNFVLLSIALFLVTREKQFKLIHTLSFISFIISVFAILGYMYSIKNLYGFLAYTPMALNTAICFIFCSLSILFLKPRSGFMTPISVPTLGGFTARRLIPAIIIIPSVLGWLRLLGQQSNLYSLEYGSSLLVIFIIIILFALVYKISIMLNNIDNSRLLIADSLEREKEKAEAILKNIGDAVFAINTKGNIVLFNQSTVLLSGFKFEEAINQPYDKILQFVDANRTEHKDAFIHKALNGSRAEMEKGTFLIHKDGRTIPVADSASPILDLEGRVHGVVVVFRDITRDIELEKRKDTFLSIASHELRTPMTAIKGFISMILDEVYGPVPKNIKEPLHDIANVTQRLIDLVTDMLNVSRIEAGRVKLSLMEVDIKNIIDEVLVSLQPIAVNKKLKLVSEKIKTQSVQIDPNAFKQILSNLVGNSLKFTDSGSITVSTYNDSKQVHILVKDTGIGIAPEDQKKLFGKFVQINSQQKGRPVGTGLGLYLSKELARKMGGDLWVENSIIGEGSTFAFSVPIAGSSQAKKVKKVIDTESQNSIDQKTLS